MDTETKRLIHIAIQDHANDDVNYDYPVGRIAQAFYTFKTIVALLLDRQSKEDEAFGFEYPIIVAMYDRHSCSGYEFEGEDWNDLTTAKGLLNWRYAIIFDGYP